MPRPLRTVCGISIHALREEGDVSHIPRINTGSNFYPRPPRGGRPMGDRAYIKFVIFLSTPSARRATTSRRHVRVLCGDFYPRPPRGGRLPILRTPPHLCNFYPRPPRGGRREEKKLPDDRRGISIHALREEGDLLRACNEMDAFEFLSTPSARRATEHADHRELHGDISIHALREEGDQSELLYPTASRDFYPRPPRGGRHEFCGSHAAVV